MISHSRDISLGQTVFYESGVMETVTHHSKTWMTQYRRCKEKSDVYGEMI